MKRLRIIAALAAFAAALSACTASSSPTLPSANARVTQSHGPQNADTGGQMPGPGH